MLVAVVLLMYLAGWLYSRHLPERWRPGGYDLVGNSHQWMHALVRAC
jgi:Haemolysin-III related